MKAYAYGYKPGRWGRGYGNEGGVIPPLGITPFEPLGCHLQAIYGVADWNGLWSEFDSLLKRNHGKTEQDVNNGSCLGGYFTGCVVSVRDNQPKVQAALKERGFVLLGTQDGAHGTYKMELWGQGFTLPQREEPQASK